MVFTEICNKGDNTERRGVDRSNLNSDNEKMTFKSSATEDKDQCPEIGRQQE